MQCPHQKPPSILTEPVNEATQGSAATPADEQKPTEEAPKPEQEASATAAQPATDGKVCTMPRACLDIAFANMLWLGSRWRWASAAVSARPKLPRTARPTTGTGLPQAKIFSQPPKGSKTETNGPDDWTASKEGTPGESTLTPPRVPESLRYLRSRGCEQCWGLLHRIAAIAATRAHSKTNVAP